MPRYFFHIEDGTRYEDDEGTELDDLEAARDEASRILGSHLRDHPREPWSPNVLTLTVQDERGLTLFVITVSGHESAAIASSAANDSTSRG